MSILLSGNLPLGLDGIKILLHLLNFLLLLGGVTFLVYKPVKKFIEKRQNEIIQQYKNNERAKAEAEKLHSEYLEKLAKAESEIMIQRSEAERANHIIKENAVSEASQKAEEIISRAEIESQEIKRETISGIKNKVADVAVTIAEALLEREISSEENEQIIDKCINEWTQND
ncbi:MAG: ATP synthase subunit b [Firmicutes bacterium ADurb.Bin080]|nr:MAG: ATP synthase subunit b [Firmicutes bacterium ADurb.Bin080]